MSRDADGRELNFDDGYSMGHEDGRREVLDALPDSHDDMQYDQGFHAGQKHATGILRSASEHAHADTAQLLRKLAREIEA